MKKECDHEKIPVESCACRYSCSDLHCGSVSQIEPMKNEHRWRESQTSQNCRAAALLLLLAFLVSGTACHRTVQEELGVRIWIRIACNTPVYGVHVEYEVDRVSVGEMGVSVDAGMSRAIPDGDTVNLDIPARALPEGSEPVTLCLQVFAITADGTENPLPYLLEWSAARETAYRFTLFGDASSGFEMEADGPFCVTKSFIPHTDEASLPKQNSRKDGYPSLRLFLRESIQAALFPNNAQITLTRSMPEMALMQSMVAFEGTEETSTMV